MIKIKAKIRLKSDVRKTGFTTGYRPLFNFINESKTSGKIVLIEQDVFKPGEFNDVFIYFSNKDYLGSNFKVGKKFTFDEGIEIVGEGEIMEIYTD
ncbi:hypothetical protein FIA58_020610 [Flavobacterium jejuense]|uniref:Translation elongation factor EFTu/EF1A C-terminal domain-containing protein n=1 Tax=Flavobacterium jejuense TaxID=1544455 RepID=A0ABX0IW31_9FLAO|nr:hypothetical protein [Flavobacterium jejuense]NHN28087.1 hypothetical protein [Flavobacterium jejuense]